MIWKNHNYEIKSHNYEINDSLLFNLVCTLFKTTYKYSGYSSIKQLAAKDIICQDV